MADNHRTVKSTQEQAVAAWINNLNQIRLDDLRSGLLEQDANLKDALCELSELKRFINESAKILGNERTKHGEIAEHMQVNISNARRAIEGLSKEYTFEGVKRTAPEDYLKNGQPIQSKFYNGLKASMFNHHGVDDHLTRYDFVYGRHGAYVIPKDQYIKMADILEKYRNNPSQLDTTDYYLAKRIDEYLLKNDLEIGRDINPAVIDYSESMINKAPDVINKEESSIRNVNEQKNEEIYRKSQPTVKEGLKATGVSAAFEGGMAFCLSYADKRKEKELSEFTEEDWKEVGLDTVKGATKGGIRGGVIYSLTNFTQTPACVASALVTASFGVAGQVRALERGEVSEEDFVINCETVCLDVTVSAIASLVGQVAIPIPVLGAVIGNVAGEFIYELCKKESSERAQKIIDGYQKDINELNRKLEIKYQKVVKQVMAKIAEYESIESLAFDEDVNIAFVSSINLADYVGVESDRILRNKAQIDNYFIQ